MSCVAASHTGWTKASDMIAKGLCSVLASDYYYIRRRCWQRFRLAADGVLPLAQAWQLISSAPGACRGPEPIAARSPQARLRPTSCWSTTRCRCGPRIVAVIAAGRLVHLTEANRLVHAPIARKAVAAA